MSKKFVRIPDSHIEHVWKIAKDSDDWSGDESVVGPDWYQQNGTPIDETGRDLEYSHTRIKPHTVVIHVRGGVAYEPDRLPRHIKVRIIDHDNEGR